MTVTQELLDSGSQTNLATARGTPAVGTAVSATDSQTVHFTKTPRLTLTKTVKLVKDADGDGAASPGDTIRYTATMTNVGNEPANGVTFSDTPDANTTLVTGSVATSQGKILKGNLPGQKSVEVAIGTISAGGKATVTFTVTINKPLWVHQIANQAVVTGSNFPGVKSDDPGTQQPDDPTIIQVKTSPPVHGPGVSQWGIVAMIVLLGSAMVWVMRRKLIQSQPR
jgi:uncharacterized repeat protein (TIGR01451 family)